MLLKYKKKLKSTKIDDSDTNNANQNFKSIFVIKNSLFTFCNLFFAQSSPAPFHDCYSSQKNWKNIMQLESPTYKNPPLDKLVATTKYAHASVEPSSVCVFLN